MRAICKHIINKYLSVIYGQYSYKNQAFKILAVTLIFLQISDWSWSKNSLSRRTLVHIILCQLSTWAIKPNKLIFHPIVSY